MVARHLVEVALLHAQLLFVLLLQHLEVEVKEALNLGRVCQPQAVDVLEEILERLQQVRVHLGPLRREVLLHKYARDQCQLQVCVLTKNAVVRVLNQLQ